jgi:probable F420-dependent oxidoreductase
MRLGLTVPLQTVGLSASLDLARLADSIGYDDVWSSEVAGTDGFAPLAALAATTHRIRLGVALAPAFTRAPALLAMSASTLQALSGGRFVLGVGASSQTIVEDWMGSSYELPRTRVRETVEAVRAILTGEKITYDGRSVQLENFRLALGPTSLPIYVGALGPKMLQLAGEIADGVLLTFVRPESVPSLVGDVYAGAAVAGRDSAEIEVWLRVMVAANEEGPDLDQMLRRHIVAYGTVPAYNALLRRQGFVAEAGAISSTWQQGRRDLAVQAVSDELLEALVARGSIADCVARIEAYRRAGVTTVVIEPVSAAPGQRERESSIRATVTGILETLRIGDQG